MKKGHLVHVAKINTLGAMGQNADLLAKMPKIVVFWASPYGIFENRIFFAKTLVWEYNSSLKNVTRWFRKKTPSTKLLQYKYQAVIFNFAPLKLVKTHTIFVKI